MLPFTLQFLIAMIASAISERLQRKLDYAQEEVRVLKEILCAATGKERIGGAEVRQLPTQDRTASQSARYTKARGQDGPGEPELGLHEDSRRTSARIQLPMQVRLTVAVGIGLSLLGCKDGRRGLWRH